MSGNAAQMGTVETSFVGFDPCGRLQDQAMKKENHLWNALTLRGRKGVKVLMDCIACIYYL